MKKIKEYLKIYFNGLTKHKIATYSAASAYAIFISIIPFLLVIISLIAYTPINEEDIRIIISNILPASAVPYSMMVVQELLDSSKGLIPVSIIMMLWTTSYAALYFRKGLNDINDIQENKNYFFLRIILSVYMLIVVIVIVVISAIGVLSKTVYEFLIVKGFSGLNWLSIVSNNRSIIVIVGFFIAFLIMYTLLPAKKNKLIFEMPGALAASVVCYLEILVFNFLLDRFVSFSMYGSLATIMILLFYLEFSFYFFFMGAYLNKCFRTLKDKKQ